MFFFLIKRQEQKYLQWSETVIEQYRSNFDILAAVALVTTVTVVTAHSGPASI